MEKSVKITYQGFKEISDIDKSLSSLLQRAGEAVDNAYAPYSGFRVASALRLQNNVVIVATNQENAALGLCTCAEQNALTSAGSQFPGQAILEIAITARSLHKTIAYPIFPCGACRQVLCEYEKRHNHPIKVILQGESGEILVFPSAADLLPFSFSASDMI